VRYFLQRILFLLFTLWAAITLNFLIPRLMPGNPAATMLGKFEGQSVNPAALHAIEIMLGVSNTSLWTQYWQYLGQVVHFQFGLSYTEFPEPVTTAIGQALPWTVGLVGLSTIISFTLGTGLGILAAWRRGKATDTVVTTFGALTNAFPYFWFALVVVYFLSYLLNWFPLSGAYEMGAAPHLSGSFVLDVLHHGILPAFTIIIGSMGAWALGMRNNMINTLGEDYVLLATAKGVRAAGSQPCTWPGTPSCPT
jgi:peptide/nickel transport system permease protein